MGSVHRVESAEGTAYARVEPSEVAAALGAEPAPRYGELVQRVAELEAAIQARLHSEDCLCGACEPLQVALAGRRGGPRQP